MFLWWLCEESYELVIIELVELVLCLFKFNMVVILVVKWVILFFWRLILFGREGFVLVRVLLVISGKRKEESFFLIFFGL